MFRLDENEMGHIWMNAYTYAYKYPYINYLSYLVHDKGNKYT